MELRFDDDRHSPELGVAGAATAAQDAPKRMIVGEQDIVDREAGGDVFRLSDAGCGLAITVYRTGMRSHRLHGESTTTNQPLLVVIGRDREPLTQSAIGLDRGDQIDVALPKILHGLV